MTNEQIIVIVADEVNNISLGLRDLREPVDIWL